MFFTIYHIANLIIFCVAIGFAGKTVFKLKNTPATSNARLLPFAYFSLSAWIVGALQYVTLVVSPPLSFPSDFFVDTGLWLGVTQNVLWASAILSLQSEQFQQISDKLPFYKTFPIVVAFALLTYRTSVLTSEIFISIDAVFAAAVFTSFAVVALQWRLTKIIAAVFFIHGYFNWIWNYLWVTPWAGAQGAIVLAFPVWRIAILVAWIQLISAMVGQARPPDKAFNRRGIAANPVVSAILSLVLTIALRLVIETTWPYLTALWNAWWRRTIGTLIVTLFGGGLFLVRRRYQKLYGVFEVVFAVIVCWIYIGNAQRAQDAASWILVVAAAYLIVRGLTNYEEGNKKGIANRILASDKTRPV